jgi:hypothetical protein
MPRLPGAPDRSRPTRGGRIRVRSSRRGVRLREHIGAGTASPAGPPQDRAAFGPEVLASALREPVPGRDAGRLRPVVGGVDHRPAGERRELRRRPGGVSGLPLPRSGRVPGRRRRRGRAGDHGCRHQRAHGRPLQPDLRPCRRRGPRVRGGIARHPPGSTPRRARRAARGGAAGRHSAQSGPAPHRPAGPGGARRKRHASPKARASDAAGCSGRGWRRPSRGANPGRRRNGRRPGCRRLQNCCAGGTGEHGRGCRTGCCRTGCRTGCCRRGGRWAGHLVPEAPGASLLTAGPPEGDLGRAP